MIGAVRGRWTLRRRLVAVLIALLAVVAGIMGVVSAVALRGSPVGQLDAQLLAASARAARAPDQRSGPGTPSPAQATGPRGGPTAGELPPGLRVLGQGAGTVSLFVRSGETRSGYIDPSRHLPAFVRRTVATLKALPADGIPRTAHLFASVTTA